MTSTERVRRLRARNARIDAIVSRHDAEIVRRLGMVWGIDQSGVVRRMIHEIADRYADELSALNLNESGLDQMDMFED